MKEVVTGALAAGILVGGKAEGGAMKKSAVAGSLVGRCCSACLMAESTWTAAAELEKKERVVVGFAVGRSFVRCNCLRNQRYRFAAAAAFAWVRGEA